MYLIFLYVVHAKIGLNKLTSIEWYEIAKTAQNSSQAQMIQMKRLSVMN